VKIKSFQRSAAKPFFWLFGALAGLSLLSAPDATHDEMFHATNIWCGQGIRPLYCSAIRFDVPTPGALVNFDNLTCQQSPDKPLHCPSDGKGSSFRSISSNNLYPRLPWSDHATLFYLVLSWFVVPSPELSFLLTRVTNALLISVVLGAMAHLLPKRHRKVVLIVVILALPSTGYFLLASINPSSWTLFGVGFSWYAIHASLAADNLAAKRRIGLIGLGGVSILMALGSRWDAWGFILFTLCLVGFHAAWERFANHRWIIAAMALFVPILLVTFLNQINPISPQLIGVLLSPKEGQVNNFDFFTTYLLYGVPNALESLGTLPTTSPLNPPEAIFFANVVVLGVLVFKGRNRDSAAQLVGTGVSLLMITVVIMAQVALIDNRDSEGIEPRYILPLLVFAIGWWFLHSSTDGERTIAGRLKSLRWIIIGSFALTSYTVAERFTDVQTPGLRLLPEGPDQWWWSFLPVGPNTVTVLCTLSFAIFLHKAVASITEDENGGIPKNKEIKMNESSAIN